MKKPIELWTYGHRGPRGENVTKIPPFLDGILLFYFIYSIRFLDFSFFLYVPKFALLVLPLPILSGVIWNSKSAQDDNNK